MKEVGTVKKRRKIGEKEKIRNNKRGEGKRIEKERNEWEGGRGGGEEEKKREKIPRFKPRSSLLGTRVFTIRP